MIQKKSLKDAIQNPEIISVVGELITRIPKFGNPLREGFMKKAAFSPEHSLKKIEISKANGVILVAAYHNTNTNGPQLFLYTKQSQVHIIL